MFKERVKELLRDKGLTAKDLSAKMGISEASLSASLCGNPTLERLTAIASGLGVTPAELLAPPAEGILTCPHCGKGIAIKAEAVQ